ncbi:MAG: ImmA/IrrE family metallo-endopeptidase [Eubacteriaceae bacterium]|nr:ImmA/IrrE family metallo-endopeptidase [Eubacteriaceae bacterium]
MGEVNPEMVIIARESRGYSQSALAQELGIPQGKLSKIETGTIKTPNDVLSNLTATLSYPEEFFFQRGRIYPGISYHRKRKSIAQKELYYIDANTNIRRMHFEKLIKNIEYPDIKIPKLRIDEENMSAENIALAVRRLWLMPKGPADNITDYIENAGCIIIHCDFGTRMMDGLSICSPAMPPMMFINKNLTGDRLRFTIAHELGHIVMHDYPTLTMEDEANKFAAEFLMPENDIYYELENITIDRLVSLKIRWKVSMQALLYRAASLETITERSKQYLWMRMGQSGYRTHEPIEIELEKPSLYKEIIDTYLDSMDYTLDDLCQLLCIHEDEFHKMYSETSGLRLIKKSNDHKYN